MSATNAADRAHWAAQETVLASPDVFGDWFGAELMGAQAQLELPAKIREEVTAEDFNEYPGQPAKSTAYLYMLMVDLGQSDQVRLAAVNAIAGRYLRAKDDYVRQIALADLERRVAA
jgi:hypothetical protein